MVKKAGAQLGCGGPDLRQQPLKRLVYQALGRSQPTLWPALGLIKLRSFLLGRMAIAIALDLVGSRLLKRRRAIRR